ncbi:hypothetical protein J3Q64DRAFT_1704660 [Phycomyces blakesleeanus]|uniref:F-box domain-containing protein n=2 Tax=Phycomyces blakesleeanus TaxID=4837 RepID=A0A167RFD7_PHYB8|nr:hypothetical protein PHYBLDRAFT_73411 [Phycomyces blakesleeanus NRRL 1555(-)]OAD81524.1 hypothetical protein PHYBLDRAFT_73411 [Phycomyces blakesleeanus NRRL 1555(-)]|eukprot:XP_018299564.1 hypothetical protein PHYBLDRAFT_73411 [Phycomyces blakesleeanus NRRL 1555(-)]
MITMTAYELPPEILTQIGDNLSTRDNLSCALTCKRWRSPFEKALWKNTRFYSYYDISKLTESVKVFQHLSLLQSLWVHSLSITRPFSGENLLYKEFYDLLKFFPNLKHLDVPLIFYRAIYTHKNSSDSVWKYLKSLKISYETSKALQPAETLLKVINMCSMLQELIILGRYQKLLIKFGVDDFDSMHQHLQDLSSIKADIDFNSDFSVTLYKIPNTIPAFTMTSPDICLREYDLKTKDEYQNQWNPLWLYYFGYKYPNLRSLKLEVLEIDNGPINSDQRQRIISLFQSNPNAFRRLETFDLTTNEYFEFSDFILMDFIDELKAPLKHLKLRAKPAILDVSRVSRPFSETLESLSFTGYTYGNYARDSTFELSYCYPLLTNLCISGRNVALNLSDLLDKCVALKRLKLCHGKLVIDSNMTNEKSKKQKQQHGLHILILRKYYIPSKAFHYISLRCRGLKHMTLHTLRIKGLICTKTGCLLLDMPHTFLKSLNICQVEYGASYKESQKYDTYLTLVSQLNDAPSSDKKNERVKYEINSKFPVVASHNIDWIYTYLFSSSFTTYNVRTTKLSKRGASIAFEYYRNSWPKMYPRNLNSQLLYDKCSSYMTRACELQKGYGQFRFGKIEFVYIIGPSH